MSSDQPRVLVVDDDPGIVDYLLDMLRQANYSVAGYTDTTEALNAIAAEPFDLVISDVEMPGMRGLDLIAAIHRLRPEQLVLLMTAFGSIDLAMQSVRAGACEFLTKPFRIEELYAAIERALLDRQMRRTAVRIGAANVNSDENAFIAHSPRMQQMLTLAKRAAAVNSTVLLTGESGTGKSAVARWIHDKVRADKARSCRSIVQRFRKLWSKANCSEPAKALTPMPIRIAPACSCRPTRGRCFLMRLPNCLWKYSLNCSKRWNREKFVRLAILRKQLSIYA